jgi:hypothetical protein
MAMKPSIVSLCFLARVFAHSPTVGVEPIAPQDAGDDTSSLVARVVRADGSSVEGAQVSLISKESMHGLPMHASGSVSDASTGRVQFEHIPATSYTLIARWEQPVHLRSREQAKPKSDSGDLPTTSPVWWGVLTDVKPDTTVHEITLAAGAKQEFRVTTANSDSISQVEIHAVLRASGGFMADAGAASFPAFTLDRHITTNAGRFALDGLAPGLWACALSADKYGRTEPFTLSVPSQIVREIVVPKFLSIAGEIHAPEGVSNAKVWVGITYTDACTVADGQVATYSDSTGKFEIRSARPGKATLRAESIDADRRLYRSKEVEILLEAGKDTRGVQLDLAPIK